MDTTEDIEMARHRGQLDKDVAHLVDKYLRIFEWDIPESDEPRARRLIVAEIRDALSRLEGETLQA
jgi:hypothetical protein